MKKRKRQRFFSIIFVPDQEQEPKSMSMSYARGRVLMIILILLGLHVLIGALSYFQLFHLRKVNRALNVENKDYKTRNKKIEQIAAEFAEIRETEKKIRQAFGVPLGLQGSSEIGTSHEEIAKPDNRIFAEAWAQIEDQTETTSDLLQNQLLRLSEGNSGFFDPEYLPTMLPVEGLITTRFQEGGWYVGRSHLGIDIAAKKGTHVRASGAGMVVFAAWTPDFGNVVVISHKQGFFSYYAHAMRLLVSQGNMVRKGQIVALVGSSGFSSAPHLHFEIWKDSKPLDPEKFIYAMQSRKIDIN